MREITHLLKAFGLRAALLQRVVCAAARLFLLSNPCFNSFASPVRVHMDRHEVFLCGSGIQQKREAQTRGRGARRSVGVGGGGILHEQ